MAICSGISVQHCVRRIMLAAFVASPMATAVCDDVASPTQLEFFEKKVRPLLVSHCYECHSDKDVKGGLRLDSSDGWKKGGDSGVAIMPHEPDSSRLIDAIRYSNEDLQMPPAGKLSLEEIQTLEQWVRDGALDPRTDTTQATPPALTGMSIEDGRKFWSFVPVQASAIPEPTASTWAKSPCARWP